MPAEPFQYTVLRIVPRLERGEFLNAGVLLFCRTRRYLAARIALDHARLHNLDPGADALAIERQLAALAAIVRGDPEGGAVAALPQSERFHWLAAPSSTVVQAAPIHSGLCDAPEETLAHLFVRLVA